MVIVRRHHNYPCHRYHNNYVSLVLDENQHIASSDSKFHSLTGRCAIAWVSGAHEDFKGGAKQCDSTSASCLKSANYKSAPVEKSRATGYTLYEGKCHWDNVSLVEFDEGGNIILDIQQRKSYAPSSLVCSLVNENAEVYATNRLDGQLASNTRLLYRLYK